MVRIAAALLIACSLPRPAGAAETNHSWTALIAALKGPHTVAVTGFNKDTIEGPVASIDDNAITIRTTQGDRRVAAKDVLRVRDVKMGRRRMFYGIVAGAAIGAAVTTAVDQASAHPSSKKEAATIGALVIGAPAGAVAGRLLRGRPLYEAPGG